MSAKPRGTVASLLRLRPYVADAMPRLAGGAVAALLGSLVALAIPQVLQRLVDGPLAEGDASAIWPAAGLVLLLGVLEAVFILLRRAFVLVPSTRIEARMRMAIYRHLDQLPVAVHDRWPSGQLLSRAVGDLSMIRRWLAFGIVLLVVNTITVVVGFAVLLTISVPLALVVIVVSVPIWLIAVRFLRRYKEVARLGLDQVGDLATSVEESVHGIRVLKAFGRGGEALGRFSGQASRLRSTELQKARLISVLTQWLNMLPDLSFALVLLLGAWLVAGGSISVGQLAAFFATTTVLRWPIESIGHFLSMTVDARTATDRFFEIIDTPNTITDPEHLVTLRDPRGELVFDDVHFRYPDAPDDQPDLLAGVSLRVAPGETLALVGVTGSGKSTLTNLVTRLFDVTGGAVRLDGVDVRDLSREELRRHVAMAFEDATLFSATVRENVLMGRPVDEPAEEAEAALHQALDIAQADFVERLPAGADTVIGEEGLSLSGGQRQRLALARAVAARPTVLVLDDPLSALDVDTEAAVEAGLRRVLAETTALVVAHRPSTVLLADRVAVLREGRIDDVGTHAELLARNAHYRYVISSLDAESGQRDPAGAVQ